MPYEAFSRALEQIAQNYSAKQQEQQLHDRDRAEKLADVSSSRAYEDQVRAQQEAEQIRMLKAQSDISYGDWVKRSEKTKDDELRALGIEPTPGMSPQEKFSRRTKALQDLNESNVKADAIAKYNAGEAVKDVALNDPNFATDTAKERAQTLIKNKDVIDAHQADYAQAVTELRTLVSNDPAVANAIKTPSDLATQKAQELISHADALPPAQRDAMLRDAASTLQGYISADKFHVFSKNDKATTGDQARQMILAHPMEWAQANGIVTPKTEADLAKMAGDALRAGGYADRPEITGLIQRINHHVVTLTDMGVTPKTPPAPSFFKPAAPTTAPAATGPVFRAPGAPAIPQFGTPDQGAPKTFFSPDPMSSAPDQSSVPQAPSSFFSGPTPTIGNAAPTFSVPSPSVVPVIPTRPLTIGPGMSVNVPYDPRQKVLEAKQNYDTYARLADLTNPAAAEHLRQLKSQLDAASAGVSAGAAPSGFWSGQ